jgi:hypothetical protein
MGNQSDKYPVNQTVADLQMAQVRLQTCPLTEEETVQILRAIKSLTILVIGNTKKD